MRELPEGWSKTTLGSKCFKIGSGSTPRGGNEAYKKEGISLIRSQNILDFIFSYKGLAFIDELQASKLSNVEVFENDILINITGDSVARVCKVPKEALPARVNQHVAILRTNKEELNSNYLKYYLLNPVFKKYLLILANSGGTRNALTKNMLEMLELNLPSPIEQKSIAEILTSFDEKIELLHKQNEILETIAQTVFKEWFVNFNYLGSTSEMKDSELGKIPREWHVRRLGDVLEIKRGGSPRPIKDYIADSGYRWLKISDATATKSPFIFKIKEHIKKEGLNKTTLLKSGALILSNSATPGIPKFLEIDSCIHDGWLHFPKTDVLSYRYLYLFFKHIRAPLLQQGNGSVFKNLKTDILKNWIVSIPDGQTITKFDDLIQPIFEKIKHNSSQIQNLSKTRDTLLPKLMNGKVRAEGFGA
ncbi:MAG: restriction endonuclease subunit S [Flavobacteriales bacterium]|nr:restriction endonuclease subunit S [Flavobacteriales bacterium]